MKYVYTQVPGKIKPLLAKLKTMGVPPKATVQWLKSAGFTSSSDATLAAVLKFIGFTDSSGVPTQRWLDYRGDPRRVLGKAIREGYSDLFRMYPDAQLRSSDELTNVFSTSSSGGQQVISKTVGTFKALAEQADFDDGTAPGLDAGPLHEPMSPPRETAGSAMPSNSPSLHVDVQVHISPEATSEQIESIFKSMARHLYGRKVD
jgi:hypothetical protein